MRRYSEFSPIPRRLAASRLSGTWRNRRSMCCFSKRFTRQLADLVQEHHAHAGMDEHASLVAVGPGEGALAVAE
jgi:hypothetical protein